MKDTAFSILCSCFAGLILLNACVYHDIPAYACTEEYTFTEHVQPILQTKCAISGCHNGDMGADLNWTNFEEFQKRVKSGLVKYNVTHRVMPPEESQNGPLTQEQINTIACWVDQGGVKN